jgi:hypothetical protein
LPHPAHWPQHPTRDRYLGFTRKEGAFSQAQPIPPLPVLRNWGRSAAKTLLHFPRGIIETDRFAREYPQSAVMARWQPP